MQQFGLCASYVVPSVQRPGAMAVRGVGARRSTGCEPVVELPPMIGTRIGRIDAELLDGVDSLEHVLDLGSAGKSEKNLPTRPHIRNGREDFTGHDSAQDVDPRDHRAEVVRCLPDIGKDADGREAQDAAPAIENLLGKIAAEADPLLDRLLRPGRSNPLISLWRFGAGEGIRTLDPNLGKVADSLSGGIPRYPTPLSSY
jgi:hypothetical protein